MPNWNIVSRTICTNFTRDSNYFVGLTFWTYIRIPISYKWACIRHLHRYEIFIKCFGLVILQQVIVQIHNMKSGINSLVPKKVYIALQLKKGSFSSILRIVFRSNGDSATASYKPFRIQRSHTRT